jgi:hypothetical protein
MVGWCTVAGRVLWQRARRRGDPELKRMERRACLGGGWLVSSLAADGMGSRAISSPPGLILPFLILFLLESILLPHIAHYPRCTAPAQPLSICWIFCCSCCLLTE